MYRLPTWVRVALFCVVILSIAASVALEVTTDARRIHDMVDDFGPFIPVVFLAAHVIASLTFVPRSVMALVASMLFGFWQACLWATVGSTVGALVGFYIARYINGGLIEPEQWERVGPLVQRAEEGGWRAIAIVRLMPLLPHALTNYVLGLTRISYRDYIVGSVVGMVPETYVFVKLAISGRDALIGGAWIEPLLWGLAFIALSALPKILGRWAR
jgi:uncharacterized membrane protein YdjX (TVP38/TMEM64 family)